LQAAAKFAHKVLSLFTTITAQVPVTSLSSLQKYPFTPFFLTKPSRAYPISSLPMHPKNVTFP
jgi:hypothetical protein